MPQFKKGQIVAVRQFERDLWVPAVFQSAKDEDSEYGRMFKARRIGYSKFGVTWRYCVPAQEIWPWLEKMRARVVCDEV